MRSLRLSLVVSVAVFFTFALASLLSGCGGGGGPAPSPAASPAESPVVSPSPSLPVRNVTRGTSYATIQEAIDDARNGDTIVVSPGTYRECIDFGGKNITVRSEDPDNPSVVAATILDGGGEESVVTFKRGEGRSARLEGFTIRNGAGTEHALSSMFVVRCGGGIYIEDASPTIMNNVIRENSAIVGGGIVILGTSLPEIASNSIVANQSQAAGGGIAVLGNSSPIIYGNSIRDNAAIGGLIFPADGGGIYVENSASVRTRDGYVWPRDNCPPAGMAVSGPSGITWTYQGNTFSGNTHRGGQTTSGCHVYFGY